METGDAATVGSPGRRRGRSRRRLVGWTVLLLFLAVLLLGLLMAWQAFTAYQRLDAASARIPQLRQQVVSGDDETARQTVAELRDDAQAARDALDGPQWGVLAAAPVVGDDVAAVRTVTEVVDDLGDEALPALLEAGHLIDPGNLAPHEGRVRLAPIEKAAPHVGTAHEAVARAAGRLAEVDTDGLADQLRGPVSELAGQLEEASSLTRTAARAAELLPSMLGADEPRTYLLLTQNNAEPRALGGLPGAAIVLRADDGRLELLEQTTAFSFPEPVLRLTEAEVALYGTQLGRYFGNVTATPDFPRAGRLARRMWALQSGRRVDGVASVDPYALQLLLRATRPVELPTGHRLTGGNAARVILNEAYFDFPDDDSQDAFFAAAAAAVFERLTRGSVDTHELVAALGEATRDGRVMLWSAHEREQAVIAGTALSGALTGRDGDAPVVGVYVHDRSAAKLGFYEYLDVRVRETGCGSGERRLRVRATVRSEVPVGKPLPDLLDGGGGTVPEGHIRTDLMVYAPAGGLVTEVRSGGEPVPVTALVHDGLHVAERTVELPPGKSITLTYDVRLAAGLPEPVQVRATPLPTDRQVSVVTSQCN